MFLLVLHLKFELVVTPLISADRLPDKLPENSHVFVVDPMLATGM